MKEKGGEKQRVWGAIEGCIAVLSVLLSNMHFGYIQFSYSLALKLWRTDSTSIT